MNNSITDSISKLSKIHHNIFSMNSLERINHLNYIKEQLKIIDLEISILPKKEKDNIDINYLNNSIPVFMLAYYGVSVKDLIHKHIEIYKKSFSNIINEINLKYSCKKPYKKSYKKILFYSGRLSNYSSVYRSTYEIIKHLCSVGDFYVDICTHKNIPNEIRDSFCNCKNILQIEEKIEKNIEKVGAGRYDVIIYPDLHMDSTNSCISLFRLAPYQITTFGHSETSGTADFFITSNQYEIEPEKNYIEKAVLFNSLALKYSKINTEHSNQLPRSYFQIPKNCTLYYCNSSCFKYGKEMFDIFKEIINKDKNAIIVLTKLGIPQWDVVFFEFFDQYLSREEKNKIRIIQRLNFNENLNLINLCDVFLESYPFGNMNSTLECFAVGCPVVSMPTTKINNRFTYAYYKKMNLEDKYCVFSINDYIDKAINVANSKIDRNEIKEKSSVLFDEEESVLEWEKFIRNLN